MLTVVVACALLCYWAMSRYVITAVIVQGKSMLPTLHDGDRFLLNRWAFRFRNPERGDVVVIKDPGHDDLAVKRVIAGPLDTLAIKDGDVYVNGKFLVEPYLNKNTRTYTLDRQNIFVMVGRNRYFVLGDNRKVSEDSRMYGSIRRNQIIGVLQN